MKHVLKKNVLGAVPGIELTQEEYSEILAAKRCVLEGQAIEDLFDIVLGNFKEWEHELLEIALQSATYSRFTLLKWSEAIDTVQLLARRLTNVLTTTRGYQDQVKHAISGLYGSDSQQLAELRQGFRHEYDGSLGYRVCEALRNYAQHRGSPVSAIKYASQREDRDAQALIAYSCIPYARVSRLIEDDKCKAEVLAELPGDEVDLRPHVREYVSGLGRVHMRVRKLIADHLKANDAVIYETVERYRRMPGVENPTVGLVVMELTDEGVLRPGSRPEAIMVEPIERRRMLEARNHSPVHFHAEFVTSEVLP